ncbi:DUF924 domain-containing protein [Undibacterium sp. LX40W]|uniref:DUF924 domain-containing protein n=1 Tax=Undibacterium nitidum TaxID=2762298 RepID=A0A923HQE4_9BURK|nr:MULTISPECIES: DUF924 family protein [Undibacterium]MBC3880567.1 DUF924 domain-containing protein [Undibacterium nitidum]MBC3890697.1 DUF924 domain-containing protein [Undibacterium sp. LX40W]
MFQDIIQFWFEEIDSKKWWSVDPEFDQLIQQRFHSVMLQAAAGELYHWRTDDHGRLAEIIVLDQFSRNVYRHTPQAFAQDAMALVLAQEAIRAQADQGLTPIERNFLYMPFMHSESRAIHAYAEKLFHEHAPKGNYEFELKHKAIIDRFGRYPHRNAILGRESTAEEIEFLKQDGSSF